MATFIRIPWLRGYSREDLLADSIAGTIVAIMLVPQAMAYATLAGLPPEVGLYASVLPLLLYALLGSSRTLAVGPVAIVSLLVAGAIADLGQANPLVIAGVLAVLSGVILIAAGVARLGFLVNFVSHPVIAGFSAGAAVIIAVSQVKSLFGIDVARGDLLSQVAQIFSNVGEAHLATVALSAFAVGTLIAWPRIFRNLSSSLRAALARSGPLSVVVVSTLAVWLFELDAAGVEVVGAIPRGLPQITMPAWDWTLWSALLETAGVIAIVGYVESVAVAKTLAARRRQRIDPNRELIGLGVANVGSSLSGGYPVTGGLSRSVVNFNAGARTPAASCVTALVVLIVIVAFTPLLYHLPNAALAAVIVVAVLTLIDAGTIRETWRYDKMDSVALGTTFVAVLIWGIEPGLLLGVGLSLALNIYRTSRPHVAIVGRVPGTEHYRNVQRHEVETLPHVLIVRVDESLYFPNTRYLEDVLVSEMARRPEVEHVVLVCSAVNAIDSSALDTLANLVDEMHEAGVTVHLAEVKGPVMDRLDRVEFSEKLMPGRVFLSTHEAARALSQAPLAESSAVAGSGSES